VDLTDASWRTSKRSTENGGDCVEVTVIVSGQPWI
jgi:hypothetical protein